MGGTGFYFLACIYKKQKDDDVRVYLDVREDLRPTSFTLRRPYFLGADSHEGISSAL